MIVVASTDVERAHPKLADAKLNNCCPVAESLYDLLAVDDLVVAVVAAMPVLAVPKNCPVAESVDATLALFDTVVAAVLGAMK